MRIGMFLRAAHPDDASPIMAQTVRELTERGATVGMICAEASATTLSQLKIEYDLYVLKYTGEAELSLAGALHVLGAQIVNSYPVSEMLRNKIVATRALQAAGVPVPETYVASRPVQLCRLLQDGPLVVKPYRGSQGCGVSLVHSENELKRQTGDEGPVYAQRYHKPEGRDRKIYNIGEHIFGVKREWPATTLAQKLGEPFLVTDELRNITVRCARALGIDLFGIDVVVSEGQPYVVDACSFPGFKGVPDAAVHLANYIYAAAKRAQHGEPLVVLDAM